MRALLKMLVLTILAGMVLAVGVSADAYTVTYADMYKDWPGHETGLRDQIGAPRVENMTVYVDESGYLDKVEIQVWTRILYDTLFINTAGGTVDDYEKWNYLVHAEGADNYKLYTVNDPTNYTYTYVPAYSGVRVGHPSGIVASDLTEDSQGLLASITYANNLLTYDFNTGINVGYSFVIGYAPYCANDVFLTPVPEPTTMLLLGLGLIGVAGIRRRS